MLSRNGKNGEDGKFDWADAILDAAIMSGLTFFTTLGAMGATGLITDMKQTLLAAIISSGTEFFAILAMKRKLVKK